MGRAEVRPATRDPRALIDSARSPSTVTNAKVGAGLRRARTPGRLAAPPAAVRRAPIRPADGAFRTSRLLAPLTPAVRGAEESVASPFRTPRMLASSPAAVRDAKLSCTALRAFVAAGILASSWSVGVSRAEARSRTARRLVAPFQLAHGSGGLPVTVAAVRHEVRASRRNLGELWLLSRWQPLDLSELRLELRRLGEIAIRKATKLPQTLCLLLGGERCDERRDIVSYSLQGWLSLLLRNHEIVAVRR
mmetsp:Transcript_6838/g.20847  ORF Transcript_6838/g.20847 Transcript_6838/m.20847 type:complete len:249 (+) Transcript_6838:885-1631(+)